MTEAASVSLRRDLRVLGLVGGAHFLSHFYQLTLPPLFLLLKAEFAVSYAALGLIVTLFMGANGVSQVPMGFLVDRVGARAVLVGGLVLEAGAIGLVAAAPSFAWVLVLAALAGIGHSVFHPANYAILSASVDEARMGRAFSLHTFSGYVGTALAPVTIISFAALWGWRTAVVAVAAVGLVIALVILTQKGLLKDDAAPRKPAAGEAPPTGATIKDGLALLFSAPMLMLCLFWIATGIVHSGIWSFSVVAIVAIYDAPLGLASAALTGFLFAVAAGILVGGMVADLTRRHDLQAAAAFAVTALIIAAVGTGEIPILLTIALFSIAGLGQGTIMPARDMMVRAAAPKGSAGKAFGFMSAGASVGGVVTPPLFGWIIDQGHPQWIFWILAAIAVVAIATVLSGVRRVA